MSSRVTALVVSYWPSRIENVKIIVNDLRAGTVVPDEILVLNNNPDITFEIEGAKVINSQFNSRSRGKLVACLMDISDYYLLLDDDTSVNNRTLERFLEVAHRKSCYAYCGIKFNGNNGDRVYPQGLAEETEVEYFLGCGMFLSFYCLVRSLMLDERLRRTTDWKHEAEDITIGLANKATIIPMVSHIESFKDLNWGTEAMAHGSDGVTSGGIEYLYMRNKVKKLAKELLKDSPLPDF